MMGGVEREGGRRGGVLFAIFMGLCFLWAKEEDEG